MTKTILAIAAVAVGLAGPQIPLPEEKPEVKPIPVVPYEYSWKCEDCTPEEQYVLKELQEHLSLIHI